jgi:hypothetical protein
MNPEAKTAARTGLASDDQRWLELGRGGGRHLEFEKLVVYFPRFLETLLKLHYFNNFEGGG